MFKWLLGLGLFLYAALMIAGADQGQQRAGLRAAPPQTQVAEQAAAETVAETVQVASAPIPTNQAQDSVLRSSAAALVPMLPAPPIRVLDPAPAPVRDTLTTEMPAAEDGIVQAMLEPEAGTMGLTAATPLAEGATLRWVAVERANVRADASKTALVTARIEQGEAVAVLWTDPSGWARVRIEGDGIDGFVHESLLTDINPQYQ